MNEKSNSKTDITFELKTVKNPRRSIKGKMSLFTCRVLFTCTVLSTLLFTALFNRRIDDVALIDDVQLTDEVSDSIGENSYTLLIGDVAAC